MTDPLPYRIVASGFGDNPALREHILNMEADVVSELIGDDLDQDQHGQWQYRGGPVPPALAHALRWAEEHRRDLFARAAELVKADIDMFHNRETP